MATVATRCLRATLAASLLAASMVYAEAPAESPDVCHPNGHEPGIKKIGYFRDDYYPFEAKRTEQQGRVVLEYSIKANGHADQVQVVQSASPELDSSATRNLKAAPIFNAPADWARSGGTQCRYRMQYRYVLVPAGSHAPADEHDKDMKTVVISAERRGP